LGVLWESQENIKNEEEQKEILGELLLLLNDMVYLKD